MDPRLRGDDSQSKSFAHRRATTQPGALANVRNGPFAVAAFMRAGPALHPILMRDMPSRSCLCKAG